jgi:hypothetical protein
MAKRKTYDIITIPEDDPIILTGPPLKLTGRVLLHNSGKDNVVIRDAGLKDTKRVLTSRPLRFALPKFVLRPDQGRNVNLKVALDANTPPGEYPVELDVFGSSLSAVFHVTEVFDAKIEPRRIVVDNLAGQSQQKRLIVANKGNVAITIGDFGIVDLEDDIIRDRNLQLAVEPLAKPGNLDLEELIVTVLRVAREGSSRDGSLLVSNLSGIVTIEPGETAAIDLEITLQDALPHNSRYRGRLPILVQDLEIIVVSSTESNKNATTVTAAKAPTKTTKTTTPRTKKKPAPRTKKKPTSDEEVTE